MSTSNILICLPSGGSTIGFLLFTNLYQMSSFSSLKLFFNGIRVFKLNKTLDLYTKAYNKFDDCNSDSFWVWIVCFHGIFETFKSLRGMLNLLYASTLSSIWTPFILSRIALFHWSLKQEDGSCITCEKNVQSAKDLWYTKDICVTRYTTNLKTLGRVVSGLI